MSELQQTHHDECWRQRRHHDCAVGKIERQARRIAKLEAVLKKIANEDYRGNRPNSATIAEKALRADDDE